MRLSMIAAATFALAAVSADARPPGNAPDTYGGSAWFNNYVGGVAVTGATLAECQQRLQEAIAARSNWVVTSIQPCAKWPAIRIRSLEVERSHAEAFEALRIDGDLRRQFRIEQFDQSFEATFPPEDVCK